MAYGSVAEKAEKTRDLRALIAELQDDAEDVVFQEINPNREPVTLYDRLTGMPVDVPKYMAPNALSKRREDGEFMFSSNINDVPKFQPGKFKCFLHAESPERETGLLAELGLAGTVCPAGKLANGSSKKLHAEHRHKNEWRAIVEHIAEQREDEDRAQRTQQLEATLQIARGGQITADLLPCEVEGCDFEGTKRQLQGHRMGAHK